MGGVFPLLNADIEVNRMGYGAMQLAGPEVWGPPKDPATAVAVLQEALEVGINHIDTSDFYRPHVTNRMIREALHPYREDLTIVTKVGGRRGPDASWHPAQSPAEIRLAVHDNLHNLGIDVLPEVNMRAFDGDHGVGEGSIEQQFSPLAELQQQGLIRHLGLSNVTPAQFEEARRIGLVVCVQNKYNLAHRGDDAFIDFLAIECVAYVPFFPLGGVHFIAIRHALRCSHSPGGHAHAGCAGMATPPCTKHPTDSRNVVSAPPSREPCRRAAGNSRRVARGA